jgi:outer membrane protein OmpA-like peptidoglycan-associated protein
MAFNLEKNQGAKSSGKFDLTKRNAPTRTVDGPQKRKSNIWLLIVPVFLVVGIAAWHLFSNRNPNKENGVTATETANTGSTTSNIDTFNRNEVRTKATDTNKSIENVDAKSSGSDDEKTTNVSVETNNNAEAGSVTAVTINNKVPATFPKGSNEIINLDQSLVKDIIAFLDKNAAAVVTVKGYASSEGEPAFNQHISQSRADAFKNYLISKGIAAARIIATGKGTENPVGSNDTEEGRVKNRRVEILLQ